MNKACIVCARNTGSQAPRCPDHTLRGRPGGRARKNLRALVVERDGEHCSHCGDPYGPLEVDHITAIKDGGSDDVSNLRLLCRSCHGQRHQGGR